MSAGSLVRMSVCSMEHCISDLSLGSSLAKCVMAWFIIFYIMDFPSNFAMDLQYYKINLLS